MILLPWWYRTRMAAPASDPPAAAEAALHCIATKLSARFFDTKITGSEISFRGWHWIHGDIYVGHDTEHIAVICRVSFKGYVLMQAGMFVLLALVAAMCGGSILGVSAFVVVGLLGVIGGNTLTRILRFRTIVRSCLCEATGCDRKSVLDWDEADH